MTDLWPQNIAESNDLVPPIGVLKNAAVELSRKTSGLLIGHVVTAAAVVNPLWLEHKFYIVAVALNEYQYEILRVTHPVELYPATITPMNAIPGKDRETQVPDAESLEKSLKEVFASPKVTEIVKSLLAQSKAA